MTVKNLVAESWDGEDKDIMLSNWTDLDGDAIDWTAFTTITLRISTKPGAGDTVMTKNMVIANSDEATGEMADARAEWVRLS